MGAGDVIAQMTLEKKNILSLELKRTATFTAIGVFYIVRSPNIRIINLKTKYKSIKYYIKKLKK